MVQPEMVDAAIVEPPGGACTATDSPHFEIFVVTLSPDVAVEVSSIGSLVCVE
jgi:hypothetical protein